MPFLNLPEDVRVHCFSFCDIEDLMRLETVCKNLKIVVCSRRVWLPRLYSSATENIPRIAPHVNVNALSVSELKYLTVSARRSREAWARPGASAISPTRYQQVKLPRQKYTGPTPRQIAQNLGIEEPLPWLDGPLASPNIEVIPVPLSIGNRHEYIVVRRLPYYIQILEISSGVCVWECADSDAPVIAFDVDSNYVEGAKVFRLLTVSLVKKDALSLCIIKVHDFLRGPSGGIKVDNSVTVRKLRASDNIYHAHAKLEGDLLVVSNQESVWLINWKLDKCIKVAVAVTNLQWDSIRVVEQHLTFISSPGVTRKNFVLTVVPLQEAFESSELAPQGEDGIMTEITMDIAQLPAFSSEVELPDNLRPLSATAGHSGRAWHRRRGQHGIEDVTFFIILEHRFRRSMKRCLTLHHARLENEPVSMEVPSPTPANPGPRVLRMTQVGNALKLREGPRAAGFLYRCISQSGRILLIADDVYALSSQDILSGSNDPPVMKLDGRPIVNKIVTMDPDTGATDNANLKPEVWDGEFGRGLKS